MQFSSVSSLPKDFSIDKRKSRWLTEIGEDEVHSMFLAHQKRLHAFLVGQAGSAGKEAMLLGVKDLVSVRNKGMSSQGVSLQYALGPPF